MATSDDPIAFKVQALNIADNSEGWGPVAQLSKYDNMPYAPFSRSERVGKASDFTAQGFKYNDRRYADRPSANTVFNFHADKVRDARWSTFCCCLPHCTVYLLPLFPDPCYPLVASYTCK